MSEPLLPTINSISLSNFFDFEKCIVFTVHGHDDSVSGNFNAFVVPGELFHTSWSPVSIYGEIAVFT